MNAQKVGTRGFLFTFEKPYKTTVYAINGKKHIFILDTFLGPDPMIKVLEYLKENGVHSKPYIVFNSHGDYDHYWGNSVFRDSIIISHELSPEIIKSEGEDILKKYESHRQGEVEIVLPNCTFKTKLSFEEEEIEFFHSPGHTKDSASCYDYKDKVLFIGDNIEKPFPYVNFLNFEEYMNTLQGYLTKEVKFIIAGHDNLMQDTKLIENNLSYLRKLEKCEVDRTNFSEKQIGIHFANLEQIGDLCKKQDKKNQALIFFKEAKTMVDELPEERYQKIIKRLQEKIDSIS